MAVTATLPFIRNVSADGSGAVIGYGGLFVNCLFFENETIYRDGGAFKGSGAFINCQFQRNYASLGGGAVSLTGLTTLSTLINCTFAGNRSVASGGAVRVAPGVSAHLLNCTLFANTSSNAGTAVAGPAQVANSIVWGHAGQFFDQIGSVTFSCIQDGWPGEGNTSDDPLFANPFGIDGVAGTNDDDLRITSGSLCIDGGNNAFLPPDTHDLDGDGNIAEMLPLDLDRALRLVNDPESPNTGQPQSAQTIVDRGAYEFHDFRHVAAM